MIRKATRNRKKIEPSRTVKVTLDKSEMIDLIQFFLVTTCTGIQHGMVLDIIKNIIVINFIECYLVSHIIRNNLRITFLPTKNIVIPQYIMKSVKCSKINGCQTV